MVAAYGFTPQQVDEMAFLDFLALADVAQGWMEAKAKGGGL